MSKRSDLPGMIGLRLLTFAVVAIVTGAVLAASALPFIAGAGIIAKGAIDSFQQLPDDLRTPPLPEQSVILAADGSVLATVYYQNRKEVPLTSVAPIMRQAIVAIEDSRFMDHNGIDLRGTMRALATNTSAGGVQQGGSTLTMQYVKNVLINNAATPEEVAAARERTPVRKLREMRYALALERQFSKDEILSRYLNIAYFGAGAYGIEAASQRYFSKSASELTLPEAATLAGIVQSPTAFDPTRNPDLSTVRRNVVLRRMAELGYISTADAAAASAVPMKSLVHETIVPNGCASSYAPFFCDYVLRVIRTDPAFGSTEAQRENLLKRGGLTIRTTLDPKMQQAAYDAVTTQIPVKDESGRAAAITMVEPGTGQIKAMTQNRLYGTSGPGYTTYNYSVPAALGGTIGMQAGSTFKVFAMLAALEGGLNPYESIESPQTKTWTGFKNCSNGLEFPPATFNNSTGAGTFDLLHATASSINTYFIELSYRYGLCKQADIAESMGVTLANGDPLHRVPSFALGTMEVTPIQMADAYATIANHGIYCPTTPVLDIKDRKGNSVDFKRPVCKQVVSRDTADTAAAVLTRVIDGPLYGTGRDMTLDRPAAGKTGTTNDSAAVWFSGFTPNLAASVWCGDPRGGYQYPMKDVTINGVYYDQIFGRTFPGPIWKAAMLGALAGTTPQDFDLVDQWDLGPVRMVDGSNGGDGGGPVDPTPTQAPTDQPTTAPTVSPTDPTVAPVDPSITPIPVDPTPTQSSTEPTPSPSSSTPAPEPSPSTSTPEPTQSPTTAPTEAP